MISAVSMRGWVLAGAAPGEAGETAAYAASARIRGAGPGDPAVIVEVEATYGQQLFGFVRRLGLNDAEAADAVQEVLLRLWAELDRGAVITDPKAWAFRGIYRLAMDQHRLRRRVAGLVSLLGRASARAIEPPDRIDGIAVWAEVDGLPVRQRQVIYLRYRADLPYAEIAEILGVTEGAARSHATHAMHSLRRRLQADDDHDR